MAPARSVVLARSGDVVIEGSSSTRPKGVRARGRELALLALCHLESNPESEPVATRHLLWAYPPYGDEPGHDTFKRLVEDEPVRARADALLDAHASRQPLVDEMLASISTRWRPQRMAQVDRNILRLVTLELIAEPETPKGVILAEAVRLARRYGAERSPSFVNGVADALARRLRPQDSSPTEGQ